MMARLGWMAQGAQHQPSTAGIAELVICDNTIERFFREFRTKSDEIGAFPNELTCFTVFHLIVTREHAKHDRGNTAQTG
jgi:transposase-like protein